MSLIDTVLSDFHPASPGSRTRDLVSRSTLRSCWLTRRCASSWQESSVCCVCCDKQKKNLHRDTLKRNKWENCLKSVFCNPVFSAPCVFGVFLSYNATGLNERWTSPYVQNSCVKMLCLPLTVIRWGLRFNEEWSWSFWCVVGGNDVWCLLFRVDYLYTGPGPVCKSPSVDFHAQKARFPSEKQENRLVSTNKWLKQLLSYQHSCWLIFCWLTQWWNEQIVWAPVMKLLSQN